MAKIAYQSFRYSCYLFLDIEPTIDWILFAFFREEFQGIITYYVPPQNDLKWSRMFGLMEDAKKKLCVEDYSISQTSLEEVFLSFAKNQAEDLRLA